MRLCWAGLDIQATLPTGRPQMLTRAILAIVQAARTAMTAQSMKRDARINSAFNRLDQLASNVPIATSYACHILINVRDIFRRAGVSVHADTADLPPSGCSYRNWRQFCEHVLVSARVPIGSWL